MKNKTVSRIIALALCVVMLLCFVACGANGGAGSYIEDGKDQSSDTIILGDGKISDCLWKNADTIGFIAGRIVNWIQEYIKCAVPEFFAGLVKYSERCKYAWHTPDHVDLGFAIVAPHPLHKPLGGNDPPGDRQKHFHYLEFLPRKPNPPCGSAQLKGGFIQLQIPHLQN